MSIDEQVTLINFVAKQIGRNKIDPDRAMDYFTNLQVYYHSNIEKVNNPRAIKNMCNWVYESMKLYFDIGIINNEVWRK